MGLGLSLCNIASSCSRFIGDLWNDQIGLMNGRGEIVRVSLSSSFAVDRQYRNGKGERSF